MLPTPNFNEEKLLNTINEPSLSSEERRRLKFLRAKSEDEALTQVEHDELLKFVQKTEQNDLVRVQSLVQLAKKRGQTLSVLMSLD